MSAALILPNALAEHAGGARRITLDCPPDADLGTVLAQVEQEYPALGRRIIDESGALRRFVNVFIDGEECRRLAELATLVPEGAEIHVIGSVAGG